MTFDRFRGVRLTPGRGAVCAALTITALLLSIDTEVRAAAPEITAPALLATPGAAPSADSVRRTVAAATAGGFSAVVVPASLYESPSAGGFDALAEFVRQAHAQGLRVHAAVDIKAAVAANEFPSTRTRVVYEHPEWLMVPRDIAVPLLSVDPHAPNYVGQIARWTRANAARVPALTLSPLSKDAAVFIANTVKGFVSRYEVDGLAFNDLNYPGDDFDYSRRATELFRNEIRSTLDATGRSRMDAVEAIDPFAYANEYPTEWRRFRLSQLTDLVAAIRAAVDAARPGTMISAAVDDAADMSLDEYVQEWMDNRLVDAVTRRSAAPDAIVFASSMRLSAASAPAPLSR
jgi:uncharacterized lipoprotein YddW (UPF0748 family)